MVDNECLLQCNRDTFVMMMYVCFVVCIIFFFILFSSVFLRLYARYIWEVIKAAS